jgi:hypothetical protein
MMASPSSLFVMSFRALCLFLTLQTKDPVKMMRTIAIVTALAAVVANVAAFAPSQGELIEKC